MGDYHHGNNNEEDEQGMDYNNGDEGGEEPLYTGYSVLKESKSAYDVPGEEIMDEDQEFSAPTASRLMNVHTEEMTKKEETEDVRKKRCFF